ncbi:MAG: hypothetical protein KBA66_06710 [Leptospiraceae bacterium]|nr:hypothetical protein [Leptospiraceae bacterium]
MKQFSTGILFFILSVFLSSLLLAKPTEDRGIRKAIKKADTEFFKTITLEDLDAGNKPDSEGKTLITRMEIDGVNALVGAFKNPNVEVRKRIYKELLYSDIFRDLEGVTVADFMSQDKQLKQYLDKLRIAIYSVDEFEDSEASDALSALIKQYGYSVKEAIKAKNPKAIAVMSPEFFKKSNSEDPKTVIVRFKKNGVKTLIKALEYEPGNPETKKLIIESLFYKTLGGPEKVIPKKSARETKAESLFLIADKEKNPEIRTLLMQLAQAYYFPEDSEPVKSTTKNDEKTDSDKSNLSDDEDESPNEEVKEKPKAKKKKRRNNK